MIKNNYGQDYWYLSMCLLGYNIGFSSVRHRLIMKRSLLLFIVFSLSVSVLDASSRKDIPLPEHPRPDFERQEWINLNGIWGFTFDEAEANAAIAGRKVDFSRKITVPFSWGSRLSGIEDKGDIAWYARDIKIPSSWKGRRVYLVIGASDWDTSVWFDGQKLGTHQGGYMPFEFELTDLITGGPAHRLVIKVDDTYSESHLFGKQEYGDVHGIWQTVYVEARGKNFIKSIRFTPDIDASAVNVDVYLSETASSDESFRLRFINGECPDFKGSFHGKIGHFVIPIQSQHLWDVDDPYLYEVKAELISGRKVEDCVGSYFGQRKISTVKFPGAEYRYIALNNKPIYLQMCLDQSYHPDGFSTFPSDEFMRREIEISKSAGLNGNRIHIKSEIPRKLYWADKLGLLIMADIPCFWGNPISEARAEWEKCMREQIDRDFNHPSIFQWVNFNETWGLRTKAEDGSITYLPETQEWVRSMYHLGKSLDPTRLVEDNSVTTKRDHVETDVNSWHAYRRGFKWEETCSLYERETYPGSSFNYIGGNVQGDAPLVNSECGEIHGTGDCDITWDYHIMMDTFRRHPKIAGMVYTEHHDVLYEWNGYVKYDRGPKIDGMDEILEGMKIADFHSLYYVSCTNPLFTRTSGGRVKAPLHASFMTDKDPGALVLETDLIGWNTLGEKRQWWTESKPVQFKPYFNGIISDATIDIPEEDGLYIYRMVLKDSEGNVLHHNFTTFRVEGVKVPYDGKTTIVTFPVSSYTAKEWTVKDSLIMKGLKINGFGSGWFEYKVALPKNCRAESASLVFEASSKQIFGKDKVGKKGDGGVRYGDYSFDPCEPRSSYAMTDNELWASKVVVSIDGIVIGTADLADDPADHRGILSWSCQNYERSLCEPGSYGQLVTLDIPARLLNGKDSVTVRFTVPEDVNSGFGGLALYGRDFGRYPLDPTIVITSE